MFRYDGKLESWVKDNDVFDRLFSGSLEADEAIEADIDAAIRQRQI